MNSKHANCKIWECMTKTRNFIKQLMTFSSMLRKSKAAATENVEIIKDVGPAALFAQ